MKYKWVFLIIFLMLLQPIGSSSIGSNHSNTNTANTNTVTIDQFTPFADILQEGVLGNYETIPSPYYGLTPQPYNTNLTLVGNGEVRFNLTTNGKDITLNSAQSLVIPWIDYGPEGDATYVGVNFIFKDTNNIQYFVTIEDYFTGTYVNTTYGLHLRISQTTPSNTNEWAVWGLAMSEILSYWSLVELRLDMIRFVSGATSSYNGPRKISFSEPLVGNQPLPAYPGSSSAIFRGFLPSPPPPEPTLPQPTMYPSLPQIDGYQYLTNVSGNAFDGNITGTPSSYGTLDPLIVHNGTIKMKGNGEYNFDLAAHNMEMVLDNSMKIIFPWIDFGPESSATYVGVDFILFDTLGNPYWINVMDYFAGTYANTSNSLYLRSSVSTPQNTDYWSIWGVDMSDILSIWGQTQLTLTNIRFIIGGSISYNGPREVVFAEPQLGMNDIPIFDGQKDYVFKGYFPLPYVPPPPPPEPTLPQPTMYPTLPQIDGFQYLTNVSGNAFDGNLTGTPSSYGTLDPLIVHNGTIKMKGNGEYNFDLAAQNMEILLDSSMKIIFPWIDFGPEYDATYVGVNFILFDSFNNPYFLTVMDYFTGTYANTSNSLYLRSSVQNPYNTGYWSIWGVDMSDILSIWGQTQLTLTNIRFVIGGSISYNGPREVVFAEPQIGSNELPIYEGINGNVFRGYYGMLYVPPEIPTPSNSESQSQVPTSTSTPSSTTKQTEPENSPEPVLPISFTYICALLIVTTLFRLKRNSNKRI